MQSSYKIDILKKFAKFTGIHMCLSLFFDKLKIFPPTILLNKRLQHRCFPVNVAKFLTIPFQLNTSSLRQNFDPSYLAILFWPAPRFYGPTPPAHFFFCARSTHAIFHDCAARAPALSTPSVLFSNFLSLKLFDNFWGNSYMPCL